METVIQRRLLLGHFLAGATVAALLPVAALAQEPATDDPAATIQALNTGLLAAMKAPAHTSVAQRFAGLAPAVDRAFDLLTVLQNSVGSRWATLPDGDKTRLLATFRRYTVCNYVANFDSWSGQSFRIDPESRVLSPTRVVVRSWLVPASGSPVELSYVMQQTSDGWKAVDVLAAGTISRVAVQRSDFRGLLANGGVAALVAGLERKGTDLAGGALS